MNESGYTLYELMIVIATFGIFILTLVGCYFLVTWLIGGGLLDFIAACGEAWRGS